MARVFACVALAFVVSMFYRGANGVIAPELMAALSMDPSTLGFVTGVVAYLKLSHGTPGVRHMSKIREEG